MSGRFNNDFVRANPVHPIVEPQAFAAEITFHLQGGELVRDDPHRPIGHIRFGGLRTVGHDFFGVSRSCPGQSEAEIGRIGCICANAAGRSVPSK